MSTRSFLTKKDFQQAQKILLPLEKKAAIAGDGMVSQRCRVFSDWLHEKLLQRLATLPAWRDVGAIALGSVARFELTPKSDIDLLLCGSAPSVEAFVNAALEEGLALGYRAPLNPNDWSQGIETKDLISLLQARSLDPSWEPVLLDQKTRLIESKGFKRHLIGHLRKERLERHERYESITNYLEPNIKFAPGGLRDIHQSLSLAKIFSEKVHGHQKEIRALEGYSNYLILLRQYMHLKGLGDVLVASEQEDISRCMGHASLASFMRDLQVLLAKASFLTDWMFEMAQSSPVRRFNVAQKTFSRSKDLFSALLEDPSVMMQRRVMQVLPRYRNELKPGRVSGRLLKDIMSPNLDPRVFKAVYRSDLLETLVPELRRVKGHVQHDQYHKYTVGAHTYQAVRRTLIFYRRPKLLGELKFLCRSMTLEDWTWLTWTALYHDIAKGKKGDHSTLGERLWNREAMLFGLSKKTREEVAWLIKNHLIFATAALRQNPSDPKTWRFLHSKGCHGRRVARLALFTVIDILATNPEAWTPWKEQLIAQLVRSVDSPPATKFRKLLQRAGGAKLLISRQFVEGLEPRLVESLPTQVLLDDYRALRKTKVDLPPMVFKQGKYLWVRFHRRMDQPGVLFEIMSQLYWCGVSVQEAFVQSYPDYGVYDWFKVTGKPSAVLLKKMLGRAAEREAVVFDSAIAFDHIDLVSDLGSECILTFKGKDQPGALAKAVEALSKEGLIILWAKVNTWGQQLEDVFAVKKTAEFFEKFERVQAKLRSPGYLGSDF